MERDILREIIAHKREEVETQKRHLTADQLATAADRKEQRTTHSLKQALAASPTGIIAEFKRRSPSKGWINREARPDEVVPQYEAAGAAALSILTDEAFFAGRLGDLTTARPLTALPILRKDFVIDPYQLLQARAAGLTPCCLSPPASTEANAVNFRNRPTNSDWRSCSNCMHPTNWTTRTAAPTS